MSDISSLKRAEEELRLKDAAIAIAANGIAMVDLDGRFTYVNDAFVKLCGYQREELVGSPVTNSLGESATPTLETLLRDGYSSGEEALRRKDGAVIPIHATSTVIPDESGCPVALMISFVDLTEIKQAETELRLKDAAMAASLSAILVGDLDGRTRYVNDAYVRMFGYTREEVIGRLPSDLFPEGRVAVEGLRRDGKFVGEIEHRQKNGGTVHVQIAVNLVRDASGKPVASVATMADITALRHAEQVLALRTQELERSNRELEQFAYVASHDLQEPLRMVSSYTQLLAKRYQDRLDSDANDFIAYAVGGANRMQRLINDLLAYSRVNTQGKVPKPVDSHVALGHALANLAAAIEEQQAMVSNDDLPVVSADETQLVQVFQNLIANALKFRGGEAPRVHVSAERREGEWIFSVRDNGIGIAHEFHPRLFQIFQRLHGKDVPGTGIGLALCKRIVERHGGVIWVESEEGQGATFRFTLPG
jgi:PAS domain S-box-containing protein